MSVNYYVHSVQLLYTIHDITYPVVPHPAVVTNNYATHIFTGALLVALQAICSPGLPAMEGASVEKHEEAGGASLAVSGSWKNQEELDSTTGSYRSSTDATLCGTSSFICWFIFNLLAIVCGNSIASPSLYFLSRSWL